MMRRRLICRLNGRDGFTLLELMIVIVILGILAGIAYIPLTRATEKARGEGAITNLRLILAGEKMYRLDHNRFTSVWDDLVPEYIENPNVDPNRFFDYALDSADSTLFRATARRRTPAPGDRRLRTIVMMHDAPTNTTTWCGSWPDHWKPMPWCGEEFPYEPPPPM